MAANFSHTWTILFFFKLANDQRRTGMENTSHLKLKSSTYDNRELIGKGGLISLKNWLFLYALIIKMSHITTNWSLMYVQYLIY